VIEDLVDIEPFDQPADAPAAEAAVLEEQGSAIPEAMSFDLSESPASAVEVVEEPIGTVWAPDESAAAAVQPAPAVDEGADDLNTNTLAELYISQGFYDKALEVYEGMLNDKPGNKALQQKIGQLRELAGTEEAASALRATPVDAGAREYTPPPAEAVDIEKAAIPAPAQKAAPATTAPPEKAPAAPERKQAAPQIPESAPVRGSQAASARRKETIDRLESWLKNVVKEKQ
jgi:hypothetical protein